jgi:macrolide-specific efflux system membrane fusion protein
MTAQSSVVLQGANNVVVVNSSAVTTTGSGSTVTVVTNAGKSDEKREVRNVVIGIKGDSGTEIKSGLKAGEMVLMPTRVAGSSNGFPSSRFGGSAAGSLGGGAGGGPRG